MRFIRSFGIGVSTLLLSVSLSLLALSLTIVFTIGDAEVAKGWLADADVYNRLYRELDQIKIEAEEDKQQIPPEIEASIRGSLRQAVPPEQLQEWAEVIISGSYRWLAGATDEPEILLTTTSAKQTFSQELHQRITAIYDRLPVCTSIVEIQQAAGNPLAATCRPEGYDINPQINQLEDDLLNNPEFQIKDSYTQDDLLKGPEGSEQTRAYPRPLLYAPIAYQMFKALPLILLVTTVLFSVLIVFLSQDVRQGLRRLSSRFLVAGISGLVTLALLLAARQFMDLPQESVVARSVVGPLFAQIVSSLIFWLVITGVSMLTVGLALRWGAGRKPKAPFRPAAAAKERPRAL